MKDENYFQKYICELEKHYPDRLKENPDKKADNSFQDKLEKKFQNVEKIAVAKKNKNYIN